ncbi:hypothetical protein [Glycomyces paridis]|uniref:hypothetical protein n=1 Tax=Glycomyces paridis TaxID=2126555 RepID=UPI0013050E19|nr:hypothetical protein [Glycomyces paridis]
MADRSVATVRHMIEERLLYLLVWARLTQRFTVTAVPYRRPAEGSAIVDFRCEECDAELMLEVKSAVLLRKVQRRRLWTAVVAFGAGVAAGVAAVLAESAGLVLPLSTAAGKWTLAAIVLCPVVGAFAAYGWWHESGVELHAVEQDVAQDRAGPHTLMDPAVGFAERWHRSR